MPWKSVFENGKWKVKTLNTGVIKGTHPTKARADKQVAALYANVPEGKRGGGMVYPPGYKHGGMTKKGPGYRNGGMVYNNHAKNVRTLPATSPTRPSSLGQASSSSSVAGGMKHGGMVKGYKAYNGQGMDESKFQTKMGPMKTHGTMGQPLHPANPVSNLLSKNAMGKQGAVAPGMKHGGMVYKKGMKHGGMVYNNMANNNAMAYPSQGPNHEGQLPAVTPKTTRLQKNVQGKSGTVLPGRRGGGMVRGEKNYPAPTGGYRKGGKVFAGPSKPIFGSYKHGGKTGYQGGGEVVPGQNSSKFVREFENGPGSGAQKKGYPFTGGPGGKAEIPKGQNRKGRYLMQPA